MTTAPITGGSSREHANEHGHEHGSAAPTATVPGPPVVYLPVWLAPDGSLADVAMLQLADGRIALLGYSALDRLIDCCGADQAWWLAGPEHLAALREVKPYDVQVLDLHVPVERRAELLPSSLPGGA